LTHDDHPFHNAFTSVAWRTSDRLQLGMSDFLRRNPQEGELPFERRKFGALGTDLKALAEWLAAQQVQEVVMESTAQYWKPVPADLGNTAVHPSGFGGRRAGARASSGIRRNASTSVSANKCRSMSSVRGA
jgi:hypothetical protein